MQIFDFPVLHPQYASTNATYTQTIPAANEVDKNKEERI